MSPETLAEAGVQRQAISAGDQVQARENNYRLRVDPAIGEDGRAGPAWPVTNREVYTVIGRAEETGDLLVTDRFGATAHLPEAYVREHVALAYAVTGHAAQGLTVDTGHPIVDRDSTREALYPAATRGRESNVLYLVTDRAPDAHDPERIQESGRERLAAVLDRTAAQQAATRVLAAGQAQAASLQTIGGLFDIASAELARERHHGLLAARLDEAALTRVEGEAGYGRLLRTLRETDLAGHDLPAVLDEALAGRGLHDAESVSDVLRWRVRHHAEHRDPERRVDPGDWSTLFPAQDGPVGEYVHALAERASARQAQLGRDVADQAAAWAVEALGTVPDPATAERAEWERRAGIAAAYRELRGIDDAQTSLGAAPTREQELPRTLWAHAVEALGHPADVTDHRALDDAALYQQVERWERELAAAPAWVAEQLGEAYEAAHEERVAYQLAAAELAALPPGDPRREELAAERDRAGVWADWHAERAAAFETAHEARQAWAAGTREQEQQARLAAEELDRRGLPVQRDLTPTAVQEEPGRERETGTEQERTPDVAQGVERDVAQDVEPAAMTREERQAVWRARPDRLLGEPALVEALTKAERARDTALAEAERLRAQIPGLAEQVAAGRGEQVAAVQERLVQLREAAQLHEAVAEAEHWHAAAQRELREAQQQGWALHREMDATPWWRAGTRERLAAEAETNAARFEQAKTYVDGWGEQLAVRDEALREKTGQRRADPDRAREQQAAAEAGYVAERAAAQQRDEAAVAALQQRVARQLAAAEKAGGRHGEVLAEQQRREQLQPSERAEENGWQRAEQIAEIRDRLRERSARGRDSDDEVLDYQRYQSYDYNLDHGRDHGFGMGR